MLGDGLGDPLATAQARRHEGEGVAPVEGGTGWAHRLPPRPARLQQHPVGQRSGVEEDLRRSLSLDLVIRP